jgi:hypothetical protein
VETVQVMDPGAVVLASSAREALGRLSKEELRDVVHHLEHLDFGTAMRVPVDDHEFFLAPLGEHLVGLLRPLDKDELTGKRLDATGPAVLIANVYSPQLLQGLGRSGLDTSLRSALGALFDFENDRGRVQRAPTSN